MAPHILVVNDDQSLLDLYQLLFEEVGFRVTQSLMTFEDVTDVEKLHPDLVLLDMKFGRDDAGLLLMQKLKLYPPTRSLPLILCAVPSKLIAEQEEVLRQKGIPVIYKPFDLDELLMTIRNVLGSSMEE